MSRSLFSFVHKDVDAHASITLHYADRLWTAVLAKKRCNAKIAVGPKSNTDNLKEMQIKSHTCVILSY